jgi:long-chain acyl-CoA synthetase
VTDPQTDLQTYLADLADLRGHADLSEKDASTPLPALDILGAAERLLDSDAEPDPGLWHEYLDRTRRPAFLEALPDDEARGRWAETTFAAIDRSGYTLRTLLAQRVAADPHHALFQVPRDDGLQSWSYAHVQRQVDAIAAVLRSVARDGGRDPRVALFTENCVAGAFCDLACLLHGIFVTPLNVHFDVETLAWIFDALKVDVAVTESRGRYRRLQSVRERTARPFKILLLTPDAGEPIEDDARLDELLAHWSPGEVEAALADQPVRGLHDPATAMFTSGSTGRPKGVIFTAFNLVTKRFARAAALPTVGRDEVLLCYLPLFHTFGRFLEMTGALFWGGTYVFAGDPSADTLFDLFRRVSPTGLISIPLRWQQIRERVLAREDEGHDREELLRAIVGGRLRWGLSAAGYLDPRAFRFFQRHGVALCSGFGMTEATGGITMTPPGGYRDQSVGIPLPGVHVRFGDLSELQIAGPYIARYFEADEDLDAPGPVPEPPGGPTHWLSTGDLFREIGEGHLQIVDRVKDIYKNNRGQTIAPRRVEQRFAEVDGIKRTFLAGDARAYNTILIVPDRENAVLQALPDKESEQEYFHQIVTTANSDLAGFERVVNFAVLDRDFDLERGELTPKGSYRRKAIEESFRDTIAELYQSNQAELEWGDFTVLIPRWFYRDLGILETDIEVLDAGLRDTVRNLRLPIRPGPEEGWLQVGDLAYRIKGRTVDLGLFARQPLLWAGNPSLEAFCPCKPGWNTPLAGIGEQVILPEARGGSRPIVPVRGDRQLSTVDVLCRTAQFEVGKSALDALDGLARNLQSAEAKLGDLIRRRLEALARHPDEAVRCRAYQVLVLDEPEPEYNRYLPAFIQSERTFLNTESIAAIAGAQIEPRRLLAFRRQLHGYRMQLKWPADPAAHRVFDDLFRLMCDFGRFHPQYYGQVREELASWVIFDADPSLALRAENHLQRLAVWFETGLRERSSDLDPEDWKDKLVFQESLSAPEVEHLTEVLVGTTFLAESIMLIFEGESFELADIGPGGIWISRILSLHEYSRYRVSVNTRQGKHFDIQLIIREDIDEGWVMETIFWMIAIHGYPHGAPVLGRFGCCRPELGAISQSYASDLSVWERIREISSQHQSGEKLPAHRSWRKLYVRAMALYFAGWRNSGERVVPGAVGPTNASVPEPDFRQGARIQSLTGWQRYEGPVSLVQSLVQNFYLQTVSHYPWTRRILHRSWIFDACAEALGHERALEFLRELRSQIETRTIRGMGEDFVKKLDQALSGLEQRYHPPMALEGACDRYRGWARVNRRATSQARRQFAEELFRLYRLDRHPRIARYHLFRHTYFAAAEKKVAERFDLLLEQMFLHPDRRPTQMVELSDLQAALTDDDDRTALRRLAFPRTDIGRHLQVLTVGEGEQGHVIVTSQIEDKRGRSYTAREPVEAAEVGQLYRLFLLAGFPKTISSEDRFFIALGEDESIVGGVCYKELSQNVVHLDGIVVARSLLDRGLTSALLEDFSTRMIEQGRTAVRTHFFLQSFYQRRGFQIDDRWGGLVKFLGDEERDTAPRS